MSEPAIIVENVSKAYRLGTLGAKSFADDVRGLWNKLRGKEEPLDPKVLEQLDQEGSSSRINPERKNEFWALNDINFKINPGEVVGIIGHNGAGKSTLLKILSRITEPTSGQITIRGRVSSLLEVGTGFHPELTGRENTYLNGAIHGMSKKEIDAKFEEIIEFSQIHQFVDTPVKRYSSGMYVRLAFAVAAHLEPEILIVDEVLAVGDAMFQKKSLDKMKKVSQTGRSILFVSHNLQSIRTLCPRCIVLDNGHLQFVGETSSAINFYLSSNSNEAKDGNIAFNSNTIRDGTGEVRMTDIRILNSKSTPTLNFKYKEPITIVINCVVNNPISKCTIFFYLTDVQDNCVGMAYSSDTYPDLFADSGKLTFTLNIKNPLLPGDYYMLPIVTNLQRCIDQIQRAIGIHVSYGPHNDKSPYPASQVRSQMPILDTHWVLEK
jgi:lipopolysaccharide transport system ATP-binding protein